MINTRAPDGANKTVWSNSKRVDHIKGVDTNAVVADSRDLIRGASQ